MLMHPQKDAGMISFFFIQARFTPTFRMCSAVDTIANEGVNLASRLSGMSSRHQSVRGPLSVVARRKRENLW